MRQSKRFYLINRDHYCQEYPEIDTTAILSNTFAPKQIPSLSSLFYHDLDPAYVATLPPPHSATYRPPSRLTTTRISNMLHQQPQRVLLLLLSSSSLLIVATKNLTARVHTVIGKRVRRQRPLAIKEAHTQRRVEDGGVYQGVVVVVVGGVVARS